MSDDSSDRIVRHLRSLAASATPGTRLPSTREIAAKFGAGPVTVQRALAILVADGVVDTRPGLGTFVRARPAAGRGADVAWQTAALGPRRSGASPVGSTLRQVPHDTIAMHSGYPDASLLPRREVAAALGRAARREESYRRPPVAGLPELRAWFAGEVSEAGSDGGSAWHESEVMIASGGQAALAASFRALAAPGEPIVMESPTYWGAIGAARQAGLVIVPVPRVDGAPSAADLDAAFASSGARLFYAQPNFANPTGDQWDARQRAEILDVVAAHRAFVIDDDWAHDFGIDRTARPLAAADVDGHVVYIRSLTKSMSLTMRVAAVMARGPARLRIEQALAHSDLFVSPILQAAALDVVSRPAWRRHVKALSRGLGERRDALVGALRSAGFDVTPPGGGLHLWVRLDGMGDAGATVPDPDVVAARALAAGLAISSGGEWFPAEPNGSFVRLTYGATGVERYDEAVRILVESL
jgi:DNA-binding transcriptional MocR family regulator